MIDAKYDCWVIKMKNGWETEDREIKSLSYEEGKTISLQGYKIIAVGATKN